MSQSWRMNFEKNRMHRSSVSLRHFTSPYPAHVPKAAILEAVGAFASSHVTRLAKLKKGDIASEAERLADGTGWMPAVFAAEAPQQAAQDVATEAEADATDTATVTDEPAEALAA